MRAHRLWFAARFEYRRRPSNAKALKVKRLHKAFKRAARVHTHAGGEMFVRLITMASMSLMLMRLSSGELDGLFVVGVRGRRRLRFHGEVLMYK